MAWRDGIAFADRVMRMDPVLRSRIVVARILPHTEALHTSIAATVLTVPRCLWVATRARWPMLLFAELSQRRKKLCTVGIHVPMG